MHLLLKCLVLSLLTLHFGKLHAQNDFSDSHALTLASSHNGVVLEGAASLYANPAASLGQDARIDLTASYLGKYSTDIRAASGAVSYTQERQGYGLLIQSDGIEGFTHQRIALSYGRQIGSNSYLSLQPTYSNLQIEGLGQRASFDLNLGYWQQWSDSFILSAHITHINSFMSDHEGERLGTVHLGFAIILSDITRLYSTIGYTSDGRWDYRPGLMYQLHPAIDLYISYDTSPSAVSFGSTFHVQTELDIHLGYNSHPNLGSSLSLGVSYSAR